MAESSDVTESGRAPASAAPPHESSHGHPTANASGLTLAALGIVFGDIGTSPLYTLKTVLALAGGRADPAVLLGLLSLVIWTLVIVTTIKYVAIAMSIANEGEGGILALLALVGVKARRPAIVAIGLFGAALIYGDGAVTPAISVLSALEGLTMASPSVSPYVLPGAVVILVLLFVAQPLGTERIGKAFGPIMGVWFAAIAAMGIAGILRHPAVLAAIDPRLGIAYLMGHGFAGGLVLGGIFLCVTGAEALYADMGHFGAKPIRIAWLGLVFPSLLLNYAGQTAILLEGAPSGGNIFFRLCPGPLLIPLVGLATLATIIASQAIITGTFSMTRQAIQLGWLPRIAVKQTSAEGYGQIYIGVVNWLLMAVTIGIAIGFGQSDKLASAYGIAVSLTMTATTVLLFFAMREILGWPVAVAVYAVMGIWHKGSTALLQRLGEGDRPLADIDAEARTIPRVPGTAVFLTRTGSETPPALAWHLTHNKALHETVLVLTVKSVATPSIPENKRLQIEAVAPALFRAEATFGFMDDLDIPALLVDAHKHGCGLEGEDVTYYVGHVTLVPRRDGTGLPRWLEALYAAMQRNALHVGDVLRLPHDQTVEIGRQIAI